MQNDRHVAPQVHGPDSTREIDLNPQPLPPTALEMVREQYQDTDRRCATLLRDCSMEKRRSILRLAEIRRRRETKEKELWRMERSRDVAVLAATAARIKLTTIQQRLMEAQQRLCDAEWRPRIQMSDEDARVLGARVECLRSAKRRRGLGGSYRYQRHPYDHDHDPDHNVQNPGRQYTEHHPGGSGGSTSKP